MSSENSEQHDEHKTYYENGNPRSHMFIQNGIIDGDCIFYYENGHRWFRVLYRDGERENEHKCWHENGQLKTQGFYRNGKLDGKFREWRSTDGKIKKSEFYKNGVLEGEQRFWNKNGKSIYGQYYQDGEIIDLLFDRNKRKIFLRIKKNLNKLPDLLETFIISDLLKNMHL